MYQVSDIRAGIRHQVYGSCWVMKPSLRMCQAGIRHQVGGSHWVANPSLRRRQAGTRPDGWQQWQSLDDEALNVVHNLAVPLQPRQRQAGAVLEEDDDVAPQAAAAGG